MDGAGASSSSLATHVTLCDVQMSDEGGVLEENVCIRLVPGPEKQSCEVAGEISCDECSSLGLGFRVGDNVLYIH